MNNFLSRRLPDFVLLIYILCATFGAFTGGLWAALGLGGGLCVFLAVWAIEGKAPAPDKNFAIMAVSAMALIACLNFNSSHPDLSWKEWIKLITIFLPTCLLLSTRIAARANHPKFFIFLPIAACLGAVTLGFELLMNGPLLHAFKGPLAQLEGYNRGLSYLILLAFPIMASLWNSKNRWLVLPFFLLLFFPTSFGESRTAKLALVVATPIIVLAHIRPVLIRRALMAIPFLTLGWPFAAQWFFLAHYDWLQLIPLSWRARMEIWDYISYRIMERPILGWGLGTSPVLPFQEPHAARYVFTVTPAGHPHNVISQLWVELGIPGLTLGLIFALMILHKIGRLDPRLVPFALGVWVVGFCLCLVAYNFWTDSLFAAFALTGFAFMLLEQRFKPSRFSGDAQEAR